MSSRGSQTALEEEELVSNVAVAGAASPRFASQSPIDGERVQLRHDEGSQADSHSEGGMMNSEGNHASLAEDGAGYGPAEAPPPRRVALNETNLATFERSVQQGQVPLRADLVSRSYVVAPSRTTQAGRGQPRQDTPTSIATVFPETSRHTDASSSVFGPAPTTTVASPMMLLPATTAAVSSSAAMMTGAGRRGEGGANVRHASARTGASVPGVVSTGTLPSPVVDIDEHEGAGGSSGARRRTGHRRSTAQHPHSTDALSGGDRTTGGRDVHSHRTGWLESVSKLDPADISQESSAVGDKMSVISNESQLGRSSRHEVDQLNEENLKLHLRELNSGAPLPLLSENIVTTTPAPPRRRDVNDETNSKDSYSRIPEPSETQPSTTLAPTASTTTTVHAAASVQDMGSPLTEPTTQRMNEVVEDMWSTASTGEGDLTFLSASNSATTGPRQERSHGQSLNKENLSHLKHQLESGKNPLRPELLAGLSGFMRSMARSHCHSEVSSMLVEVPRDEPQLQRGGDRHASMTTEASAASPTTTTITTADPSATAGTADAAAALNAIASGGMKGTGHGNAGRAAITTTNTTETTATTINAHLTSGSKDKAAASTQTGHYTAAATNNASIPARHESPLLMASPDVSPHHMTTTGAGGANASTFSGLRGRGAGMGHSLRPFAVSHDTATGPAAPSASAPMRESEYNCGVSFHSTVVEVPQTEAAERVEEEEDDVEDDEVDENEETDDVGGAVADSEEPCSSMHDDEVNTNQSLEMMHRKKSGTPCSHELPASDRMLRMDEYGERDNVRLLKRQISHVRRALVAIETGMNVFQHDLEERLNRVVLAMDHQLRRTEQLTHEMQQVRQTITELSRTTPAPATAPQPAGSAEQDKANGSAVRTVTLPCVMRYEGEAGSGGVASRDYVVPLRLSDTVGMCKAEFLRRLRAQRVIGDSVNEHNTVLCHNDKALFDEDVLQSSLGVATTALPQPSYTFTLQALNSQGA